MKTKTKSRLSGVALAKSEKGFTLVELMIAIMTGAILVLAAGIALVIGHTSWNEAWNKVNLQRDASYAMLKISHSIKAGTSAEVEAEGKSVRIYREGDSIRFFQPDGTNELRYQIEDQPQTTITDKVENLQFNVQGNTVTIDLKLKEDDTQAHFVSTVMMRNYGG